MGRGIEKVRSGPVVRLEVTRMSDVHKELPAARRATQGQIDQLVYELYGLP